MSVLINKDTKVICRASPVAGDFPPEQAIAYGTQMVGGVTPVKAAPRIWACRCSTPCVKP